MRPFTVLLIDHFLQILTWDTLLCGTLYPNSLENTDGHIKSKLKMDLKSDFHIDSLSVAAELIGPNHDSAAFIFGFMSLLDKLTCGIVVIGIQGVTHIVFRGLGKYQTCPGTKKNHQTS